MATTPTHAATVPLVTPDLVPFPDTSSEKDTDPDPDPDPDPGALADDAAALQVSGSEAVQMVELAHVLPAPHEEPDFRGVTIILNCCFTASGQPAQAVFKHERRVSITVQL